MTEITLEFISRQLERVLAEQAGMRDEMLVTGARAGFIEASLERLEASIARLEASITLLTLEVRAVRNQAARADERIRKLEGVP